MHIMLFCDLLRFLHCKNYDRINACQVQKNQIFYCLSIRTLNIFQQNLRNIVYIHRLAHIFARTCNTHIHNIYI